MELDLIQLLFGVVIILFLLLIVAKIIVKPVRLLVKLVVNSLIGLVLLIGLNFIGGMIGIFVPINIITVLVAGFLGIPGLILLIVVQFIGL